MIFPFYLFVFIGLALLLADIRGRLTARVPRAKWWRIIGVVAAAGPGLAPLLAWVTGRLEFSGWVFPVMAIAYLLAYLAFAAGVAGRLGAASTPARRIGYTVLLILVAIPSWVLLVLSPLVALGGLALVRRPTATEDQGTLGREPRAGSQGRRNRT